MFDVTGRLTFPLEAPACLLPQKTPFVQPRCIHGALSPEYRGYDSRFVLMLRVSLTRSPWILQHSFCSIATRTALSHPLDGGKAEYACDFVVLLRGRQEDRASKYSLEDMSRLRCTAWCRQEGVLNGKAKVDKRSFFLGLPALVNLLFFFFLLNHKTLSQRDCVVLSQG